MQETLLEVCALRVLLLLPVDRPKWMGPGQVAFTVCCVRGTPTGVGHCSHAPVTLKGKNDAREAHCMAA